MVHRENEPGTEGDGEERRSLGDGLSRSVRILAGGLRLYPLGSLSILLLSPLPCRSEYRTERDRISSISFPLYPLRSRTDLLSPMGWRTGLPVSHRENRPKSVIR